MHPPHLPTDPEDALSEPSPDVVEALGRVEGPILVLGAGGKMGLHLCLMIARADAQAGRAARVKAISRFSTVVDLPRRVAARFAGSRFLVFSTGCVYSLVEATGPGSTEKSATEPPGEYARSCLERERAFLRRDRDPESRAAIIRLNYSTEFRYGVLVDIARKILEGEAIDLAMPRLNVIWQRDAVDHILRAFPLAANPPLVLNVTGSETYSVRDLAARLGEALGKEPRFSPEEGTRAWTADASRSHALFGPPPTGLDAMVALNSGWLAAGKPVFGKPTGFEVSDGRF